MIDAVSESVLGSRVHGLAIGAQRQVSNPGGGVWRDHVLVRAVVDSAVLDVGDAFGGDGEGGVVAVESG